MYDDLETLRQARRMAALERRVQRLEVQDRPEGGGGTASMTASEILTAIKTVDGTGSGLDADLLDGLHAAAFAGTAEVTAGTILAKLLTVDGTGSGLDADLLDGLSSAAFVGTAALTAYAGTAEVTAGTILAKLLTVDGTGSGLDADTLDGQHASAFLGTSDLSGYLKRDGSTTLTGAWDASTTGTISISTLRANDIDAYNVGDLNLNVGGTTWLNVETDGKVTIGQVFFPKNNQVNGNLTITGTAYVETIRDRIGNGLGLYDDAGNLGVFVEDGGQVGIGTASPGYALDVNGTFNASGTATLMEGAVLGGQIDTSGTTVPLTLRSGGNLVLFSGVGSVDANMELGGGRQQDGNAYIDLIGDTTYSDYGMRVIRLAGSAGNSQFRHRGTGDLMYFCDEAATIKFYTTSAQRMTISATGLVGIGVTPATQKLKVLGSIAVGGDDGGTASYVTLTNVTSGVSTGSGTVKMNGSTGRNSTGWLKIYDGTAARYIPYWTTITG